MITLYGGGAHFGQPDGSPFVIKAEFLLKLANVPFKRGKMSFRQAPKGKIPYIEDGGVILGDSHFIMRHLERKYGADFSGGYGEHDRAIGWATSRMMEEHFYFLNVRQRWMDDVNFNAGPRVFFDEAPAVIRPLIIAAIRRKVGKMLQGQGLGRHSEEEAGQLARDDVAAVAAIIGSSKYLLGDRVSAADAGVFPFLWSGSSTVFRGSVGEAVRGNATAYDYVKRLAREFFPDYPVG